MAFLLFFAPIPTHILAMKHLPDISKSLEEIEAHWMKQQPEDNYLNGMTWTMPCDPLVQLQYFDLTGINKLAKARKDFGDKSLSDLARNNDLLIIDHPHSGICVETQCVVAIDAYLPESTLQRLQNGPLAQVSIATLSKSSVRHRRKPAKCLLEEIC